jgi:hypothetical protein
MPLLQNDPVAPPTAGDTGLQDFAEIIQRNFDELFAIAHSHPVRSAFPGATDGAVGDILSVDDGQDVYICVKTTRGWFRTAAMTAL